MPKVYLLIETENSYEATQTILAAFEERPSAEYMAKVLFDTGLSEGEHYVYPEAVMANLKAMAEDVLNGGRFTTQSEEVTLEEFELY